MIYPTAAALRRRAKGQHGTPADRFTRGYAPDPSGCWRWVNGTTTNGYGHFSICGVYYQAHRIAYILHRGPVPESMQLDHLCRNRWCVNPWHLEIVTATENMRRGTSTKLDLQRVAAIRAAVASGISQRKVAPMFGIDHSTVCRIMAGRIWADVAPAVAA